MRILLIYFTGTFNTLYITNSLKEEFKNKNIDVDIKDITKSVNIDYSCYDIIGIGYPIYAFNAPKLMEKYLKENYFSSKTYFIYKTSGEPLKLNNNSSSKIFKILRKHNNKLLSEYHLIMPYNIIFRYNDDFVKQILYYNEKYCKIIVNEVTKGKIRKIKSSIFIKLISNIFKIQRFGAKINSFVIRVDNKKCINCMNCLTSCPTKSIRYENNKFIFASTCQMCMRCSFFCEKNAIKIGLLNKWKVNGRYDFDEINKRQFFKVITKKSKGFYKMFIKYYENLDILIEKENAQN